MKKFMRNLVKYIQSDGSAGFLRAARSGHLERVLEFLKSNTDINICNANGLNALHLASKEGHVNVVRELVNRGANTDAATKKGNTALHIASLAGQEEVVKLLVQNNATVNVQSQNGFTPLYMAAQENHDSVVRYLLANGANQSLATEDGFTPLAVALQQGHDKVVAVLLENDTKGKVRLPALHIAAKKDDTKAAALLLQNEHNPDVTSKSGFTPLHIAAHYGNENIAALLLQRGADVNYAAKHNITPLHVAAKWGKSNMVTTLLEMKANIEAKTRDGLTPLHCAARSGHDSVVDMLLSKGAPLTAKTKNGLAPLHMASQGDHVDSARILLYNKAPVDDVTVDYLTALHVAAHCGHVRVAKMLLDRQADPNSRALNGFTPLHIACKKNRIKVVELLLKHGASIEATTESGLTPLHVASFMGCMNIVIYLIQHGSNPDTPTVRGETPLHLAARANQTDIIRILLRNGAMVDARAREQQTPLHIAARLGNVDIVVLLLQHGAAVDATTKDLYTALHIAAKEGQEEVAQVLVEHQASLSATTKKGFTPLHLAAKYGNMKVAKLLLQRDAPVDAEGRNGVTPLHVAAHYDNQNVALLLLDKGASPHAAAKNGYTPLHIAAKKNQMDIATTLLEYGASTNAESRAGFTPLHLSAQEGHTDMCSLLLEHQAQANTQAKNGLTPLHLCAQEDRVNAAAVLLKAGAEKDTTTKAGYTPLHVACHFGQMNMVRFLLRHECDVNANTKLSYTPLHQAAQQGHTLIVGILLENNASPNAVTNQGQTPLSIAQRLGYISVVETLKVVTETTITTTTTTITEEKYRVLAPETMHETFLSDSEDEGGDDFLDSGPNASHAQHVYLPYYEGQMLLDRDDNLLGDASYKYLTADEMKSLGDDSLPIDVTKDERIESRLEQSLISDLGASPTKDDLRDGYPTFTGNYQPDNVDISHTPVYSGFLVSFMVDARGGAMRGCRHSGVRVIIPPRKAASPMRITCRYLKKEKVVHPPNLMEGEALASRILEMGPSQAKFLGPVIIEVPHFASLRGKEREITILRSDNGETWREHTLEASEEAVQDVLNDSFDGEELNALEDLNTNRITRILTTDFPQYFAIVTRVRQEIHAIGPEGGMVSSTVVPQVQAVFPQGALTKKIKVGLQAQPIQADHVSKLLGNRVAVSPIVTVEPRRRKFHKPITLTIPVPQASSKGMINEYSGDAPTLRLLCSITGGASRAQWEDVTGSTPLTFVNECVSFTTTVSARFWLIDCRNIGEATKMATELYREAIHVPFMAKFVVFSKRHDPMEAALRVFCMTDDKEDKTLEVQEHFQEVAKSRDVEVLEAKPQYVEFAGNLVPVTKSGEQLKLSFFAFRENRLPFTVRIRDVNNEPTGRIAFMREPKVGRGELPQTPICNLNLALPTKISPQVISDDATIFDLEKKYGRLTDESEMELIHKGDLQLSDLCNLLGPDWVYLARQLEIPESDIHTIECEYQDDTAKQAEVMVRLWMTRAGNKATGNTLEKALSSIGREDIMKKCLVNVELVTDDMEKAVAETCLDQSGFDALRKDSSMRRDGSLDVSYDEQDIIKESESAEEASSSSADKSSQRLIHHEEKKDKEKTPSEERAIEKDSIIVERQILETQLVPEHEKGAWEEPEKEVEERIIPEKRASAIVKEEEKTQRPKHELLEELGKELGRLDSSFVPKTTKRDTEVVGQLAVEEEMIIKERKGAKSPTTEQIEVFPEQLDQSSSGADTSHVEAACLGESETWQSDDLEKAVDRLDTELAAQDVVAAPVPANQQTTADESKFTADDLKSLEMLISETPFQQEEVKRQVETGKELLLCPVDSDIPSSIENVGNDGDRVNETEASHAIESVRNDTGVPQSNDIEVPQPNEGGGSDFETPSTCDKLENDICASESTGKLEEISVIMDKVSEAGVFVSSEASQISDSEKSRSEIPFVGKDGKDPEVPISADNEKMQPQESFIVNEKGLPKGSFIVDETDLPKGSNIVDERDLPERPVVTDERGLPIGSFIVDEKGLPKGSLIVGERDLPEGSYIVDEEDLAQGSFIVDERGLPQESVIIDERGLPKGAFIIDERDLPKGSFIVDEEDIPKGSFIVDERDLPEGSFIVDEKGQPKGSFIVDERHLPQGAFIVDDKGLPEGSYIIDERDLPQGAFFVDEKGQPKGPFIGDERDLAEGSFIFDPRGLSEGSFIVDERDLPEGSFVVDERNLPGGSFMVDERDLRGGSFIVDERSLPKGSYLIDERNFPEGSLTVDDQGLPQGSFIVDERDLPVGSFVVDERNLPKGSFVVDEQGLPQGSFVVDERDLSEGSFIIDERNLPEGSFIVDERGLPVGSFVVDERNLPKGSFIVDERNLPEESFIVDERNLRKGSSVVNDKNLDEKSANVSLGDRETISITEIKEVSCDAPISIDKEPATDKELLVSGNDLISEATLQPHENLSSGKPFQERFETDDEMRDLTQRVADVASSLASTLEKIEQDIPSEIETTKGQAEPQKKEKHVRISEEEDIIYPSRGSYECDLDEEEQKQVLRSFEASVEQMLLDVETEAPIAGFEQEAVDEEFPHTDTPEMSEEEYSEYVYFPPRSLTESYSPVPCGDIVAHPRSPSSPRPTSVSSDSEEARPIKAEIKLLVTTREEGKEAVEIRSIREFVDADDISVNTFSRIVAKSPTPGTEEGRTSRGADMEPRIYEQQETSGSPVESHQHTTPEGTTVHTTQYTTPDGTTVRTTHTRIVSEGVSGDPDAVQQQMQEVLTDVIKQQEH